MALLATVRVDVACKIMSNHFMKKQSLNGLQEDTVEICEAFISLETKQISTLRCLREVATASGYPIKILSRCKAGWFIKEDGS